MSVSRLVVLGASGDLTGRYLLRALAELVEAGMLRPDLEVVGVARDDWDTGVFREHAATRLEQHASDLSMQARDDIVGRLRYLRGDVADAQTVTAAVRGARGAVVAYLALPPAAFAPAIAALAGAAGGGALRVVVEKPFGTDLAAAETLNALLHRHFPEESVFRMDHFLGKQTVQNVLGLRFANRLFEPLWCAEHVESVHIVWDETIGLEGRAGYYDHTGALRDMVQNHLLQLLALVAMERPDGTGALPLRDAKSAALRDVRPPDADDVRRSLRGRYTSGTIGGRRLRSYVDEPGVDPRRATETFAEIELTVDNERWHGVPFRLRTGKALGGDRREIRVQFRPVSRLPFAEATHPGPNVLTMTMDPDRLALDIALNGAGDPFCLDPARIEVELAPPELSAYARLLLDVFEGDPSLSIRGDEAEAAWQIIEPIVEAWRLGAPPLVEYPAGSEGPAAAGSRPRDDLSRRRQGPSPAPRRR